MYAVRTMGDLAAELASTPPTHAPPDTVDAASLVAVGVAGVALGAIGIWFVMQRKKRR